MIIGQQETKRLEDLLSVHLDELEFLWQQRREAICSGEYVLEELQELEERIEAHVDGLVLGGENSLPLLEEALQSDEHNITFSAGYVLLRMTVEYADPAYAEKVVEALPEAAEEQLSGISEALCFGPIDLIEETLQDLLASEQTIIAVTAARVLACHKKLGLTDKRLYQLVHDTNPVVRQAAWEVIAII